MANTVNEKKKIVRQIVRFWGSQKFTASVSNKTIAFNLSSVWGERSIKNLGTSFVADFKGLKNLSGK